MSQGFNIAVVGAGVSGLTAAYLLQRRHRVTVFEKNDYAGGHTNTVVIPSGPDAGTPVDTGFIVMNHRSYPLFTRLLAELGVPLRDSVMSFAYYDETSGLEYCGSNLNGLFAQRRNLFRPSFYRMIADILRFFREATRDLEAGALHGCTLGEYLAAGRFSEAFIRDHIVPMGSAIWSTPCSRMMDFPAESFARFFRNHGLLSLEDRPTWRTVEGGSQSYVRAMAKTFQQAVVLNAPVDLVRRAADQVLVRVAGGRETLFDRVVIAAHADEALAMLGDPSDDEKRLLGAWVYEKNRTVLHTDVSAMPPHRRAWSSWNYTREKAAGSDATVSVTYHMNTLQGLRTQEQYLVSLNRKRAIPPARVVRDLVYTHPTYTFASMATQSELAALNGRRNTYFCGAYFGYGFHEDGVRSGVEVARALGVEW